MTQTAWASETYPIGMDDELEDSGRKTYSGGRSFLNSENESIFNSTDRENDVSFVPNISLSEETSSLYKRTRNNRFLANDENDYQHPNLPLKASTSSETLNSKVSRNFIPHSPPGSFRSIRNPTVLSASQLKNNNDGVNIIMFIILTIGIAFGSFFNFMEIFLRWFKLKLDEILLHVLEKRSIKDFYKLEQSLFKKITYGPICALGLFIRTCLCGTLTCIAFLRTPAPKPLVSNILLRYNK